MKSVAMPFHLVALLLTGWESESPLTTEPQDFGVILCARQRQTPVLVEALLPETAIEGLDERVVGWRAGPTKVKLPFIEVRAPVQRLGDELRAAVHANRRRLAKLLCQPLQDLDDMVAGQVPAGTDRQGRAKLASAAFRGCVI